MQLIFCPLCKWKPSLGSLWSCLPVCGHVWHTFDTRGVCPKCGEKFEHTQCHRCQGFSLHKDWYHDQEPTDEVQEELSEELK